MNREVLLAVYTESRENRRRRRPFQESELSLSRQGILDSHLIVYGFRIAELVHALTNRRGETEDDSPGVHRECEEVAHLFSFAIIGWFDGPAAAA